jgi:hypothetical protein
MSRIAFAPFREIAVDAFKVRQHRASFTRNHLAKRASFQAPRRRLYELAAKTLTPSDCRTISLSMTASIREVKATAPATSPLAINPVQRIAGGVASRASEPRPNATLPKPNDRHGLLAQGDLDLDPIRRDHDPISGAPGKLRVEGAGSLRTRLGLFS